MIDTSRVVPFVSRKNLTASVNAQRFIDHMKACFVGSADAWTAVRWPGIGFSKLGCKSVHIPRDMVMDVDFMNFAKAYLMHRRMVDARAHIAQHGIMFRCLETALVNAHGAGRIHLCTVADLDEAALTASQHYSRDTAYATGLYLMQMAEYLSSHFLCGQNLKDWVSPMPRPLDMNSTTGKEAEEARSRKLPGEAELNAIAEVFANDPQDPKDIFTTSTFALLMCAPSRANEVLALRADAEVAEVDRDGQVRYGWRFYSSKGFAGDIKWIPSTMESLAKEAFGRMLKLSSPARALASWMEEHPNEFYRHERCPQVPEDQPLSLIQLAAALGQKLEDPKTAAAFVEARGLRVAQGAYTLKSLGDFLRGKLPPDFPWFDRKKGVKYSSCIFSILKNQLHAKSLTMPVMLQKVKVSTVWADLGPRTTVINHRSVFDRHGYRHPTGECYKMTTHQPRHLLNTIAQRGGLSNLALAKWSGRANVSSNQVYNHVSDAEVFEKLRMLRAADESTGSLSMHHVVRSPIDSDGTLIFRDGAAHITEFGYCVHNFVISPCTKFRDCINCTEQICVKGRQPNRDRLIDRMERLKRVLALATEGEGVGEYGADKWVTHHINSIERITSLLALMKDPAIENGALIRLRGKDFSQLNRVFHRLGADDRRQAD
ncbi:integrase [Pseudomonas sp. CFBP 13711]|uniref:integrase n=1 Tax=unclassified Pseudomonas TaxID=196821 RepID=UPI00177C8225|nr:MULTISPECIES: integrase [unclassified Pseudomonas]MBD8710106.1 integrase [Pseudomonas sp. CFBP 13711]MBD8715394.1 integrase [Pseudomonas sp. CFBP 13715]